MHGLVQLGLVLCGQGLEGVDHQPRPIPLHLVAHGPDLLVGDVTALDHGPTQQTLPRLTGQPSYPHLPATDELINDGAVTKSKDDLQNSIHLLLAPDQMDTHHIYLRIDGDMKL